MGSMPHVFKGNATHTLGVEIELQLIDSKTGALANSIASILERVPPKWASSIKPEFMQSYCEINTDICNTVKEVESDLSEKLQWAQDVAEELGLCFVWAGTHPFSRWEHQKVTPGERYAWLLHEMQDVARRMLIFGLHVHVGVDSGDKAIHMCDRLLRHLPTLLAISANSPLWCGRDTGMQSYRSKVIEALPTAGLPQMMRNWSEYVWLVDHLIKTKFISSIREIWWDVRPHHNFGTVEVRVCDMPGNLHDTLAIAALVQCLVKALSDEIDNGTYQHDSHPMMVQQNKWRAARFGNQARLVDTNTYQVATVADTVEKLADLLQPTAAELGCEGYLNDCVTMAGMPSAAQRQLDLLAETGDPNQVVHRLIESSRITSEGLRI